MYNYETEKKKIYTKQGLPKFLQIVDNVRQLTADGRPFRYLEAVKNSDGDSWFQLACMDLLVEMGRIRCLSAADAVTQHRIYEKRGSW